MQTFGKVLLLAGIFVFLLVIFASAALFLYGFEPSPVLLSRFRTILYAAIAILVIGAVFTKREGIFANNEDDEEEAEEEIDDDEATSPPRTIQ